MLRTVVCNYLLGKHYYYSFGCELFYKSDTWHNGCDEARLRENMNGNEMPSRFHLRANPWWRRDSWKDTERCVQSIHDPSQEPCRFIATWSPRTLSLWRECLMLSLKFSRIKCDWKSTPLCACHTPDSLKSVWGRRIWEVWSHILGRAPGTGVFAGLLTFYSSSTCSSAAST